MTRATKEAFAKHDLYQIEQTEFDFCILYSKKNIPKIKSEMVAKKGTRFVYFDSDEIWYDDEEIGLTVDDSWSCNWAEENLTEPTEIEPSFNEKSDKNAYDFMQAVEIVSNSAIAKETKDGVCDWLEWRIELDDFSDKYIYSDKYRLGLFQLIENAIEKYRKG